LAGNVQVSNSPNPYPGGILAGKTVETHFKRVLVSLRRFKSLIVSPDPESEPAASRTWFSTLIPRGFHGDKKRRDKLTMNQIQQDKPRIQPGQKHPPEKNWIL
jgi:hypothetical protein